MPNNCIFCKIIADDIPSERLYEDDTLILIRDIEPKAEVHLLGIPKAHFANIGEFLVNDPDTATKYLKKLTELAQIYGANGEYRLIFNTGESAGQTVFHTHGHILAGENVPGF